MTAPPPRQPLLTEALVVLRAPTQTWSAHSGDLGAEPIHGVYHGDVRHISTLSLHCADSEVEWISTVPDGASRVVFGGLLRGLDDPTADPRVRLRRERTVAAGLVTETWTIESGRDVEVETTFELRVQPDFASLHAVKAGIAQPEPFVATAAGAVSGDRSFALDAPGGEASVDGSAIVVRWPVTVPAHGRSSVGFDIRMSDPALVVAAAPPTVAEDRTTGRDRYETPATRDDRLARWLAAAGADLDALRLVVASAPGDAFFAAGAPWFFTLFGRDALWAARLALAWDPAVAASTLRVIARLQGVRDDPATAEQPGKMLHELRATEVAMPGEGVVLPPLYYGSVDATPLWVCLLADAWRAGMPDAEVQALLPHLQAALGWLVEHGDGDGDGFLDYIDRSGTGLANQGWKDSGDSIQWRDGRLAEGPIALCEVQGYAYEAALAGADLLEAFGLDPGTLRDWAADLRARFRAAYWVTTPEGRYPAVALDGRKRAVDSLTSNIGHLLGTGILDPDEERGIVALLTGPSMATGFGVRTLSTGAAGYWPLSYHGGSVWAHDTAIVARGMALAGFADEAAALARSLVTAAAGFDHRMPELYAGDPASETPAPTPYPAACRPQAWSAAAAFACAAILEPAERIEPAAAAASVAGTGVPATSVPAAVGTGETAAVSRP